MPLTRHPEPEEIECLIRNGELRTAIEPYIDESVWEIDFRHMPTEAENRFLESMLAWEQAPVARWLAGSIRRWRCSQPARSMTTRFANVSGT